MQMARQAAQRRFHVRRVLHQKANEPERLQPILLTDEESEMRAARPGGAVADNVVAGCQGDAVLAVIEQSQVVPQFAEHLLGIRSQAPEEVGDGQDAPDADHRGARRSMLAGCASHIRSLQSYAC